jgi:hypothetical protein
MRRHTVESTHGPADGAAGDTFSSNIERFFIFGIFAERP